MAIKTKPQTVTVKRNEEKPEPVEVIAQAIIDVSAAFKKVNSSRLEKRAIILLIKDMNPNLTIGDINSVLYNAAKLEETYIKKPVK